MDRPNPANILADFERQGFVGPLRVFSSEQAQKYRAALEAYEAEYGSTSKLHMKSHLYLAFAWELTRTPAIADFARQLMGPDVLILASRFWIKEAGNTAFVSWHQDSTYFGLEPDLYFNMWIALSDASVEAGCMRFIPGSHTSGIVEHEMKLEPDNLLTRGQTIPGLDASKGVPLPLQPGECSIHHGHVMHWSPPNLASDRRIGFGLSFIPAHVRSTTGRRSATLLCGEDKHGHWDLDPYPTQDRDPVIGELMHRETKRYVPGEKLAQERQGA
ncbi:MAG: phytanoyl-CoA dioxygenase family protein [Beijerinckiaceae bacterium]